MALRNTVYRYGAVTMTLHWATALLIVAMIVLGIVMVDVGSGTWLGLSAFELYQLHKSVGFTVLAMTLGRLLWRFANPVPPLPDNLKWWERSLARVTHVLLYALLLILPVTGWLMVSTSIYRDAIPTVYFGWFEIPHIAPMSQAAEEWLKVIHETLAFTLIGVLVLHIAGALKHHLVLRDDVLRRMLPFVALRGGADAHADTQQLRQSDA